MPDWIGSMLRTTQVLTYDCVFALGETECLQHCVNTLNLLLAGHSAGQAQQGCIGQRLLQGGGTSKSQAQVAPVSTPVKGPNSIQGALAVHLPTNNLRSILPLTYRQGWQGQHHN
jgi:hypothetical protein